MTITHDAVNGIIVLTFDSTNILAIPTAGCTVTQVGDYCILNAPNGIAFKMKYTAVTSPSVSSGSQLYTALYSYI